MKPDRSWPFGDRPIPTTTAELAASYSVQFLHVRRSSIALVAALILALGGIYAIDRWLAEVDQTDARIEAAESAALIHGVLALHAEALQSLRAFYVDTEHTPRADYVEAHFESMREYAHAFQWVWTADSAGLVQQQHAFNATSPGVTSNNTPDSVSLRKMAEITSRAGVLHRLQIARLSREAVSEPGIVMVVPLFVNRRLMGYAGGVINAAELMRSIEPYRSRGHGSLLVLAGADTIAGAIPAGRAATPKEMRVETFADFTAPGGDAWRVAVVHDPRSHTVRYLLWGVGLAMLLALVVSLLHERRQGVRLAERSAELERLSAELLRANRAKSEFLANVSHELRTPLNAIVGFVDLLRDGVYGDLAPRQIGPVDRIASSANHLRQLVDQVLDLAKMAAGRLELHPEPIDLRPFVLDVASEIEALVSERGLNFSIAVSAALPRVRSDPLYLRQILVNLLGNAVKFTSNGGIAVRARLISNRSEIPATANIPPSGIERPWIALQVADTGVGIAAADRERVFEEFEQVNAGPRGDSAQRGTGLGLPISRRLARLLGGDITVDSEQGKGSTFSVWLPADIVSTPTKSAMPTASPVAAGPLSDEPA